MLTRILLEDTTASPITRKEKTLYFLLLFFFLAIYMPRYDWVCNVGMWAIFVYSFFINTVQEKWALLKKRPAMLLMIIFFIINLVSALLSKDVATGISWVGIRISLLAFPVAIGSIVINQRLKDRIVYGFIFATCLAAVLCILTGVRNYVRYHDLSLLYNDNLSDIINLQSIYFAMLINLAFFGMGYLQLKKSELLGKYTWVPVLLVLLPVHFLLASRIGIIILYSFVFLFCIYMVIYKKMIRQGLALAAGLLLVGIIFFSFFPKTLNRFRELGYTKFNYSSMGKESHFNMALTADQWNGANLRLAVWGCAWTVAQQHIVFGTGLGDKMDMLKKQYAVKGFTFGIVTNRNVHNCYLDVLMSLGLLGFIAFTACLFVLPYADCIKPADWYGALVVTCLSLSMISETYLDRTMGVTILSFFLSFIAAYKKPAVG